VVVRNYEGYMSAYTQPETYARHDPATCPACQRRAGIPDLQAGVSGLLSGQALNIKPEGFEHTHQRETKIELRSFPNGF